MKGISYDFRSDSAEAVDALEVSVPFGFIMTAKQYFGGDRSYIGKDIIKISKKIVFYSKML